MQGQLAHVSIMKRSGTSGEVEILGSAFSDLTDNANVNFTTAYMPANAIVSQVLVEMSLFSSLLDILVRACLPSTWATPSI